MPYSAYIRAVLMAWLIALPVVSRGYARVWQADLSLWAHAARYAPRKPRPTINYGLALARAGDLAAAEQAFVRAIVLTDQPHVPPHDQREALEAATGNLTALAVAQAMGAQ